METTLNLVFEKASGKKHTMRIADAKLSQDPIKVKALMDYIVDNNLIYVKDDALVAALVAALEANLQNVTENPIEL